jgi:branched-chain amino acid transport system substrate-binding protein
MKKIVVLALILLIIGPSALLGTTGCTRKGTKAEKVLAIAVQGPFTGPAARVGDEFKGAAAMAFDEIGGKIGDYHVKLVYVDCQSDPEKACRAYEDAVLRDKVVAGILNWHSSVAVALMEVTAKYKVPHFFGCAATDVINEKFHSNPEKYGYWMTKIWAVPEKLNVGYVECLDDAAKAGLIPEKRVAVCAEDTDWGRSFAKSFGGYMQQRGWEVVSTDFFGISETEFYPLLTKVKGAKARVVCFVGGTAPVMTAFVKQAHEIGLPSLIIADGLGWAGEWYQMTGKASDYVLDQMPQWTKPEAKAFVEKFEKNYGFKPSPAAGGLAYDGTRFFIKIAQEALKKYGELTSDTLYKVGKDEVWTGKLTLTDGILMKEYRYTPDTVPDPVVGTDAFMFPVVQYFEGQAKIIWPPEWKQAELQVPAAVLK